MVAAPSNTQAAVEQAILEYLKRHPHAADSAEGVAQWWLGKQGATVSAQEVEQALDGLAALGRLRRVRLADGTALYSKEPDAKDPTRH
jgi:Fe2+ or Zn2+ uptake regulation protein